MILTKVLKPLAFVLAMIPLEAQAMSETEPRIVIAQATGTQGAPTSGTSSRAVAKPASTPVKVESETQAPAPTSTNPNGITGAEAPQPNPYCEAVVDVASDARFAWQAKTLEAMRVDLEERAAKLEEKRAETELWLKRRQEFLDRTEGRIVSIYARMRADAAAAQIAAMQDDAAVALLSKIDARAASAIFNEMEPGRAAHLTSVITGVLKRTAQNKAKPK